MSDEILAKSAPNPYFPIKFPIINPHMHPSGQWTPGVYKSSLIAKAKIAL
jgi:hypothetical protein